MERKKWRSFFLLGTSISQCFPRGSLWTLPQLSLHSPLYMWPKPSLTCACLLQPVCALPPLYQLSMTTEVDFSSAAACRSATFIDIVLKLLLMPLSKKPNTTRQPSIHFLWRSVKSHFCRAVNSLLMVNSVKINRNFRMEDCIYITYNNVSKLKLSEGYYHQRHPLAPLGDPLKVILVSISPLYLSVTIALFVKQAR